MKKRMILGAITILAAIPGLFFIIIFAAMYGAPVTHWIVIEKMLSAIICFIGGVLLFKDNELGQPISLVGWALIFWVTISSIFVALRPETSAPLRTTMLSKAALYLLVGLPTSFILLRDMIKAKKV